MSLLYYSNGSAFSLSLSPIHMSPPTQIQHTIKMQVTQIIISINGASSSCSSGQFLSYCLLCITYNTYCIYIYFPTQLNSLHFNSIPFSNHSVLFNMISCFNKSSIWIYNIYIEKKVEKSIQLQICVTAENYGRIWCVCEKNR